jgi:hypothetical protein
MKSHGGHYAEVVLTVARELRVKGQGLFANSATETNPRCNFKSSRFEVLSNFTLGILERPFFRLSRGCNHVMTHRVFPIIIYHF